MKNNLEAIRKEQGRLKGWIAEKAGIRANTLTDLINGADPHLSTAYKVAKVLNKSVYDIWPDSGKEEEP